jgi:hypothetical protein
MRAAAGVVRASTSARRPVETGCYVVGLLLIVSGVAHLGVALADPRPWLGPLSWRKPVTFGVSFGSTLIAITWVASYLQLADRTRSTLLGIFAVDCVLEVTGITIQAWRHVPSHFDTETPFDSLVAFSLAAGGAVLVVVLGALAITAFRGRVDAAPGMRLALRAGFALLVAGLAAGVAMIVRGEILINTGHRTAAYDSAGFLKWFHAVTLHAVLVLPALAWWLERTDRTVDDQRRVVARVAAGYVVVAAGTLLVSVLSVIL